jgi:hypothetical protein
MKEQNYKYVNDIEMLDSEKLESTKCWENSGK